jgi:UDP-2-acetamido-3-amino-2,3-dideoxy-glucuronate N-acetyltransferase
LLISASILNSRWCATYFLVHTYSTLVKDIHATATLGSGTTVGSFSVIGANVSVGSDCQIGAGVVIHDGTRIGSNVRIDDHAVIGKQPMRAAASAVTSEHRQPPTRISDSCIIGSSCHRVCWLRRWRSRAHR